MDDRGRIGEAGGPKFRLIPTAGRFTLQLRDAKGNYAGPIVAPGTKRSFVVAGFRAGARLGRIAVKRGYGVTGRLGRASLDVRRTAIAKRGRPIGAGNLGLVKAKASGPNGPGLDIDRDGVPAAFDVDDDGDLVIDNVDTPPARAAFNYAGNFGAAIFLMNIGLEQSRLAEAAGIAPGVGGYALNRNATQPFGTDQGFQAMSSLAMRLRASLLIPIPREGTELDCTGLAYCVGSSKTTDMSQTKRFPADFDPDGDGFGTMTPIGSFNAANDGIATIQQLDPAKFFGMKPGVDFSQLHAGQMMLEHSGGAPDSSANVNFVFQTVPALARWGDDQLPIGSNPISYPIKEGVAGSGSNPAVLHYSRADGDYWLELGFWRPQAQSAGGWQDIGRLTYFVAGRQIGGGGRLWHCPATAYRIPPGIPQAATEYLTADGVYDDTDWAPVDPNREVDFAVDISACQRASGIPVWNDGDQTAGEVSVAGMTQWGDAAEGVGFDFKPEQKPAPTGGGPPPPAGPPATGTWSFAGGTPGQNLTWTVHMNDAGITKLRIQFHQSTPIKVHGDPSGWTCSTVTVSNPDDALECTHPTGESAGTDVSGSVGLQSAGSDGMPVTLTVTENGTDTASDMTQK